MPGLRFLILLMVIILRRYIVKVQMIPLKVIFILVR